MESPSTDEEEVDIHSVKFNPIKALYSKKFKIQNVKKFDNVATFMSRLKKAGNSVHSDLNPPTLTKDEPKTEEVDKEMYHVTAAGRKFLIEQAPVHRGPKAKYSRNIFTRMENVKGPLALLSKFKVNKTRVKIYVRKEHGVRGFITGIIEAFDKHLNIALVDCIEQWKRRKFKFSENKVSLLGEPKDCSELLAQMRIEIPKIITKSIDRKNVQCTRKIPQLMVRGEEVILIGEDKDDEGCRGY